MALPFERLDAWKISHELTVHVYSVTKLFPADEKYRLTDQLRRSASSAAANLAEGSSKASKKDFARYVRIAIKSLNETGYWLILARDTDMLDRERWETLDGLRNRVGKLCWFLLKSLT